MNGYMISPIGFLIIAIYSASIWGATLLINRLLKKFSWRWILIGPPLLTLLSLPWAEEAWIAWHFNEACKDAGVKVYRQVEVEGYLDALLPKKKRSIEVGSYVVPQPVDFEKRGYKYYEEALVDGGAIHHERIGDQIVISLIEKPISRYMQKRRLQSDSNAHEEPIGWKIEKIEYQVIDLPKIEIIGRDIHINRGLPIHEALWTRYIGGAMKTCPPPNIEKPPFPEVVLKPISKS